MTVVEDAERYRRELQAHCYRMLGSTHEADDAVQEALVRAWRGADRFEGRTSLRTWLYRIATNVSLTMLARRASAQRVLPQLVAPASTGLPGPPAMDVPWLEPYPDAALEAVADERPGPQARYEMREATQLAFVAAIQYLPPRQRAVLLLRDVLGWSAAETASALDTTLASVTSALQRARETLKKNLPDDAPSRALQPHGERERRLLERYVAAWENIDLDGFVALLKEDAIFAMPPRTEWYRGPAAIRDLLTWVWQQGEFTAIRLVPVGANGQPAYALYERAGNDAPWRAHAIHVLTLDGERIAAVMNFMDTALFPTFGLPLEQ
ncbi:MAG: sigma-70 family RNA polymerase sigma factor [Candidatus Eremiobacteraeota bacterium]|nr:sigma-70 family RNA polymerase sigma factor [Candidatus Eremiobacteraeota bacterium]MBV9409267.1 sigma-70 family RNA polymerase sigma factor [Candidatus Eremiobacteraeota bacterium]